jgi:hypothetical protein
MFTFNELFQWDRFIAPATIKIFFWLSVGITTLFGVLTIGYAIQLIADSPGAGVMIFLAGVLGIPVGILFARWSHSSLTIIWERSAIGMKCEPPNAEVD